MWALDRGWIGWFRAMFPALSSIFLPNFFAHKTHPRFRVYRPVVSIPDTLRPQIETAAIFFQTGLAGIDGDRGDKQHWAET